MFASTISANKHGSAAAATTAAALPPLAARSLTLMQPPQAHEASAVEGSQAAPSLMQLPSAAVMTRAATETLGNMGIEYGIAPAVPATLARRRGRVPRTLPRTRSRCPRICQTCGALARSSATLARGQARPSGWPCRRIHRADMCGRPRSHRAFRRD